MCSSKVLNRMEKMGKGRQQGADGNTRDHLISFPFDGALCLVFFLKRESWNRKSITWAVLQDAGFCSVMRSWRPRRPFLFSLLKKNELPLQQLGWLLWPESLCIMENLGSSQRRWRWSNSFPVKWALETKWHLCPQGEVSLPGEVSQKMFWRLQHRNGCLGRREIWNLFKSEIFWGAGDKVTVFWVRGCGRNRNKHFQSLLLPWLLGCCEGYFITSGWQAQAGDGVGKGILIYSVIETKSGAMAINPTATCPNLQ